MAQVSQAVNAAPAGHWIDASEEACRDVLGEFRTAAYETALQMRIEATEKHVAFPPSEPDGPRGGQPVGPELLRAGAVTSAAVRKAAVARRVDARSADAAGEDRLCTVPVRGPEDRLGTDGVGVQIGSAAAQGYRHALGAA